MIDIKIRITAQDEDIFNIVFEDVISNIRAGAKDLITKYTYPDTTARVEREDT